jgi:hypothetical protein
VEIIANEATLAKEVFPDAAAMVCYRRPRQGRVSGKEAGEILSPTPRRTANGRLERILELRRCRRHWITGTGMVEGHSEWNDQRRHTRSPEQH